MYNVILSLLILFVMFNVKDLFKYFGKILFYKKTRMKSCLFIAILYYLFILSIYKHGIK